jgi:hypothetical protein
MGTTTPSLLFFFFEIVSISLFLRRLASNLDPLISTSQVAGIISHWYFYGFCLLGIGGYAKVVIMTSDSFVFSGFGSGSCDPVRHIWKTEAGGL